MTETVRSVYRHFPSKAALRDAVAERWLARVSDPWRVTGGLLRAYGTRWSMPMDELMRFPL